MKVTCYHELGPRSTSSLAQQPPRHNSTITSQPPLNISLTLEEFIQTHGNTTVYRRGTSEPFTEAELVSYVHCLSDWTSHNPLIRIRLPLPDLLQAQAWSFSNMLARLSLSVYGVDVSDSLGELAKVHQFQRQAHALASCQSWAPFPRIRLAFLVSYYLSLTYRGSMEYDTWVLGAAMLELIENDAPQRYQCACPTHHLPVSLLDLYEGEISLGHASPHGEFSLLENWTASIQDDDLYMISRLSGCPGA